VGEVAGDCFVYTAALLRMHTASPCGKTPDTRSAMPSSFLRLWYTRAQELSMVSACAEEPPYLPAPKMRPV
jgi:hypothetical protein